MTTFDTEDQREVWAALRAINDAWLDHRPEDVGPHLHEGIVMVPPGFQGRASGREAAVGSYRDFLERGSVQDFVESDAAVDVFGDTAVVSYRFDIEYTLESRPVRERGRDLFVFTREEGRWLAVWRTILEVADG